MADTTTKTAGVADATPDLSSKTATSGDDDVSRSTHLTPDVSTDANASPVRDRTPEENSSPEDQGTEGTNVPSDDDEPEVFTREYVEKLRKEAADARVRAKRSDDLTSALWTARVAATGRLADPSDLAMPEGADPLDDDALTAAVDDLLLRKPHMATRRPAGDVGQGATGVADTVDLAGLLRSRA